MFKVNKVNIYFVLMNVRVFGVAADVDAPSSV